MNRRHSRLATAAAGYSAAMVPLQALDWPGQVGVSSGSGPDDLTTRPVGKPGHWLMQAVVQASRMARQQDDMDEDS